MSPGFMCSMLASCGSITASSAAAALNIRPATILTRSTNAPYVPFGLDRACTWVSGVPCGTGSATVYWFTGATAATRGSRASAAKYAGSGSPGATSTWDAFAQVSSRG
jgi:hypothetical protein